MDHALLLVHAAVTWAMVGLIWLVQLAHYPLMASVGGAAFEGYHHGHLRRVTWVVGPLMLAEVGTALALIARPPAGLAPGLWLSSLALLLAVWVSTAALQVPAHRRLERGFDARAHAWLVRTNWVRTLGWSTRGVLVLALLAEVGRAA